MKFGLLSGLGRSFLSRSGATVSIRIPNTTDDYSFLSLTLADSLNLTFNDVNNLTAGYAGASDNVKSICDLPRAEIRVTREPGNPPLGLVNEPISVQPADTNGQFRIIDCK